MARILVPLPLKPGLLTAAQFFLTSSERKPRREFRDRVDKNRCVLVIREFTSRFFCGLILRLRARLPGERTQLSSLHQT